jgi:hypothetical protein
MLYTSVLLICLGTVPTYCTTYIRKLFFLIHLEGEVDTFFKILLDKNRSYYDPRQIT